ncbi:hypothetical protein J2Z64_003536 [Oceanobacillus polygoni]|uniref:Uncharacterized protein n=1 Tax=Oceanobacillus polygoni TaxID=1235259 RepID=A0A9X1CCY3_9BACI|nr:hypothetical protein [Oceanobacillus polygoni]
MDDQFSWSRDQSLSCVARTCAAGDRLTGWNALFHSVDNQLK